MDIFSYMSCLRLIAADAKVLNQTELFDQAKKAHDKVVSDFKRAKMANTPAPKKTWEKVLDSICNTISVPSYSISNPRYDNFMAAGANEYLEDNFFYQSLLDQARKKSSIELTEELKMAVDGFNKMAKQIY